MIKETSDPDVLVAARISPMGCVWPFLLGIGITVLSLVFVRHGIPWFIGVPAGVGLISAGLYRQRVIIDRANKRIEIQGRCVVRIVTNVRPIDSSGHVELRREMRRMGGRSHRPGFKVEIGDGSQTVYPLVVVSGDDAMSIGTLISEAEAQRDAKRLARFLDLPLHDSSSGTLQVRQPQLLYESLAQRTHRLGLRTEFPAPTGELRTVIETSPDKVHIAVPPQGWNFKVLAACAPVAVFGVLCLSIFWTPPLFIKSPEVSQWILGIGGTIFLGILPVLLGIGVPVADAARQVTLDVSPEVVHITTRWLWWQHSRAIRADAIEDVSLSGPAIGKSRITVRWGRVAHERQIVIRTDKQNFMFGRHLLPPEQDYLCSVIRATLEA